MTRPASLSDSLKNYAILTAGYIALTILLPANKIAMSNYNLSAFGYHILLLAIGLPLLGIWFAAFYGYARLSQYTKLIDDTPEGKHFNNLTWGFIILAWGMTLNSIASLLLNAIANSFPGFHSAAIIIVNYFSIVVPLLSFSFISTASRGLINDAKVQLTTGSDRLMIFGFIIVGLAYSFVTFRKIDLQQIGSTNNPYFLPTWLIILTIALPSLYAWIVGLFAAYEMNIYGRKIHGVLYKKAMRLLSIGVVAVVASSVGVQYLHAVTPRSGHLSLNTTLLITNITYIFTAIGYILLCIGANRLKKIEEV